MRVLLTNNSLGERAGSELYLRDVAVELMRRGHRPVAYSTNLGRVAEELRAATIPVLQSLDSLGEPPDIIHGQHHYETLSAMLRFPQTPAIAYCHGWTPWQEEPLRFPRILRYVAVDELCRERLIAEGGIPPERVALLFNFFDARLFPQRVPLPEKPRTALAFSNTFDEHNGLSILREACRACGIELHATGLAAGQAETDPGALLRKYDLVFAKARAAIEALAVGNAVILCNPGSLGPLVTTSNFPALRPLNFGVRVLDRPLEKTLLVGEILKYKAADAQRVTATVRDQCELQPAVDSLIDLYESVIAEAKRSPLTVSAEAEHAAARYLEHHASRYKGVDTEYWKYQFNVAEKETRRATRSFVPTNGAQRTIGSSLQRAHADARTTASLTCTRPEVRSSGCCRVWRQAWLRKNEKHRTPSASGLRAGTLSSKPIEVCARRLNQVTFDAAARERELARRLETKEAELTDMLNWPAWKFAHAVWQSYPMRFFMRPASRAVRKRLRWLGAR